MLFVVASFTICLLCHMLYAIICYMIALFAYLIQTYVDVRVKNRHLRSQIGPKSVPNRSQIGPKSVSAYKSASGTPKSAKTIENLSWQ